MDFETANARRHSACALGIIKVEAGEIIEKQHWYIRPKPFYFHPYNVYIHGIKPEDVRDEPDFSEIWREISTYLENNLVVAHNASFDISVLRHVLDLYDLDYPQFDYLCTKKLAEKQWPHLDKYGLKSIAKFLDVKFKHHDAMEDAYACAQIAVSACKSQNVDCLYSLARELRLGLGKVYQGGYRPARIRS
ncbi:exonuclease domain-containing protein [Natranaerobius thermophilus JW/NM-WN-LF]|nr:exonuclease domain-containing protein [Natranaerobius thermophilus]